MANWGLRKRVGELNQEWKRLKEGIGEKFLELRAGGRGQVALIFSTVSASSRRGCPAITSPHFALVPLAS